MEQQDFIKEQYRALRAEVDATKARLFRTVCLGLVVVPVLTFLAERPQTQFVGPILPFVVLVLTILFVAEEHALMRCGRFIRERIEPHMEDGVGWEAWLETQPGLRFMDKCLFGCFLITFFVFYFASSGMAIERLLDGGMDLVGMTRQAQAIAAVVLYGIGALWMLITVLSHWRSATATSS